MCKKILEKKSSKKFTLQLKGRSIAFIDWANIYAQQKKQKWEINVEKLEEYLFSFEQIKKVQFFHGTDFQNKKSQDFIQNLQENSQFEVFTKKVKHQKLDICNFIEDKNIQEKIQKILPQKITIRKCDFDTEISGEMIKNANQYKNFLLFSGDGDFKYAIEEILKMNPKARIYVFSHPDSLGQEIWELEKKYIQVNRIQIKHIKKCLIRMNE